MREGIVDKAGSWYSYQGDRIGQGKENVREFLIQNKEMAEEIEGKIRAKLLPATGAAAEAEAESQGEVLQQA